MWNSNYYVYIIGNWNNKVIYTGITNDLRRRIYEHKNKMIPGFTSTYNLNKLVYFEHFSQVSDAIKREKSIKKWKRDWKNKLINQMNPQWIDLYDSL